MHSRCVKLFLFLFGNFVHTLNELLINESDTLDRTGIRRFSIDWRKKKSVVFQPKNFPIFRFSILLIHDATNLVDPTIQADPVSLNWLKILSNWVRPKFGTTYGASQWIRYDRILSGFFLETVAQLAEASEFKIYIW